jgi:hypothetical protein
MEMISSSIAFVHTPIHRIMTPCSLVHVYERFGERTAHILKSDAVCSSETSVHTRVQEKLKLSLLGGVEV